MNKKLILALTAASALTLAACGGGGNPPAAVVAPAPVAVGGVAAKGPYQPGSTVTAYQLVKGVRGQVAGTGTVNDALGNYTINIDSNIPGPYEVVVVGTYVDETTGAVTTTTQPTSVVIADAKAAPAKLSLNPIASIQAELVKQKLATAPAGTTVNVAQEIKSAGTLALQALNIPTVDKYGKAVDPAQIDILDPTADPAITTAAITAAAVVADLVNTSATSGITSVATFATKVATAVSTGTTVAAQIPAVTASTAAVAAKPIITNLTTGVQAAATAQAAANPTNAAAQAAVTASTTTATVPTGTTDAAAATTATAQTTALATLKGFALVLNQVTLGATPLTVGANGTIATAATAATTGLQFGMGINDLGAGNGPLAQTFNSTFSFGIKGTNNLRAIAGTISPVKVTADGLGGVTITAPATAVLTYTGINTAGTAVSGKIVGVPGVFTAAGGINTFDATAALNLIKGKSAAVVLRPGTYAYELGVDFNLGIENAGGTALTSLLPLSTNAAVSGRSIRGNITVN